MSIRFPFLINNAGDICIFSREIRKRYVCSLNGLQGLTINTIRFFHLSDGFLCGLRTASSGIGRNPSSDKRPSQHHRLVYSHGDEQETEEKVRNDIEVVGPVLVNLNGVHRDRGDLYFYGLLFGAPCYVASFFLGISGLDRIMNRARLKGWSVLTLALIVALVGIVSPLLGPPWTWGRFLP